MVESMDPTPTPMKDVMTNQTTRRTPGSFRVIGAVALIWNGLSVVNFVMHGRFDQRGGPH